MTGSDAQFGDEIERRCSTCGKPIDDLSYELWLFHSCRSCAAEPAPGRWSAGMAPGTSIKWSYTPRWHLESHPETGGTIIADGGVDRTADATESVEGEADVSAIIDRLEDIRLETGYDLHRVFRDWMALAVYAFERNDEEYHERLDRYARDPHDEETRATVARLFSEALGELAAETIEAQRPVVGNVYEETQNNNEDEGQFFTPWNASLMKARMIISADDAEDATHSDPLRVADPACGSARLLVAAARTLQEHNSKAEIIVSGTDKDRTCARMAVVNLLLAGIPGRIRFGDSLTMDIHEVWHVDPNGAGPVVSRLDDEEIPDQPSGDDDNDDPEFEQQTLVTDGGTDQDTDPVERRRPSWWALEPCVHRRDEPAYELGHHSKVTNHYVVEVTREINHGPHNAADELGLRVEHKLNEVVDEYDLVHTDVMRIAPIYDDTLAGRRLIQR